MKSSLATAFPLAASTETKRSPANRKVLLLAACAGLALLILNVFHRESYSGDEGFYGVTALNMLRSPDYILRPSYYPAGNFLAEKEAFAHPPFNSYFYALSLWVARGSMVGPEVVNLLAFALLLYFAYRVAATFDGAAARYTILLLAVSPAILTSYSQLEAEPLMVTFGIMALFCSLRAGIAGGGKRWLFLSGLCVGFAFALKLWLCGPLGLAVLAALVMRARQWEGGLRPRVLALLIFGVGVLVPPGTHLLAIALSHPEDLAFWLKNIYFGVFASAGISGSKLAGAGVYSDWVHPFWYYGPALYRDHFFLLPIILLGLRPALREAGIRPLLWIIAAGLFGLVPLSLIKVKEPLYVLSCAIFIYFLAGVCLSALARRIAAREKLDSWSLKIGGAMILGLLFVIPLAYARGIQAGKITGAFVLAHSITFAAFLVVLLWSQRKASPALFERSVYGLCALALVVTFGFGLANRPPRDKTISQIIQPFLQGNPPDAMSLIASNFKSYQFYSYHQGCYWHELPAQEGPETVMAEPRFATVRAFILDSDDLQKPAVAPWLGWLATHATEKTAELDAKLGRATGVRLFLREGTPVSSVAQR